MKAKCSLHRPDNRASLGGKGRADKRAVKACLGDCAKVGVGIGPFQHRCGNSGKTLAIIQPVQSGIRGRRIIKHHLSDAACLWRAEFIKPVVKCGADLAVADGDLFGDDGCRQAADFCAAQLGRVIARFVFLKKAIDRGIIGGGNRFGAHRKTAQFYCAFFHFMRRHHIGQGAIIT